MVAFLLLLLCLIKRGGGLTFTPYLETAAHTPVLKAAMYYEGGQSKCREELANNMHLASPISMRYLSTDVQLKMNHICTFYYKSRGGG